MSRWLLIPLFLLLALPCQAQRFLRPADTLTQMQGSNPSDPNTNVLVTSVGGWYFWNRGSTDSDDGTNVLSSTFVGAPTGRYHKVSMNGGLILPPNITNYTVVVVDNIAQLKSLSTTNGLGLVLVRGYFNPGSGGGAFYLDTVNAVTPDDGMTIAPNNGPHVWRRFLPETFTGIRVDYWGIVTNSTIALAQSFLTNIGGGDIVIPKGTNYVDPPIRLENNITLTFETGGSLAGTTATNLIEIVGKTNVAVISGSLITAKTNIYIASATNVIIRDTLLADGTVGIGMAGNSSINGLQLEANQFQTVTARYGNLSATTITNLFVRDDQLVIFSGKVGMGANPASTAWVYIRPSMTNGGGPALSISPTVPTGGFSDGNTLRVVDINAPTTSTNFSTAYSLGINNLVGATNGTITGWLAGGYGITASYDGSGTSGVGTGVEGVANTASPLAIGLKGLAHRFDANQTAIGVLGVSRRTSVIGTATNIGGAFLTTWTNVYTSFPNPVETALLADNLTANRPVAIFRTNQVEVFKVDESGNTIASKALILTNVGVSGLNVLPSASATVYDFSAAAGSHQFRINGTTYYQLGTTSLYPLQNSATQLGATNQQWAYGYIDTVVQKDAWVAKTITAGGTTGNQTINKMAGRVNFAGAAQTITVSNNQVTTNSVIMATVATDDTTAKSCIAVPGAGTFVLKLDAAATAETAVSWIVFN